MARPSVALATWSGLPDLFPDDRLLVAALEHRGYDVRAVRWDSPEAEWDRYEAVAIRSTWDYHRRASEFLDWAERCARRTRLFNDLGTVRWNAHKSYLIELAREDVPVIPTEIGRPGESLRELARRTGWRTLVIKPAVSANAENTFVVAQEELESLEPRYQRSLSSREMLVQPFMESVVTKEERSLVYFDGGFSHAFRKSPALPHDLRSFDRLRPVEPSEAERAAAESALGRVRPVPLYARADLVEGPDGPPLLMELELIEPYLGFGLAPGSAGRFADRWDRRLRTG